MKEDQTLFFIFFILPSEMMKKENLIKKCAYVMAFFWGSVFFGNLFVVKAEGTESPSGGPQIETEIKCPRTIPMPPKEFCLGKSASGSLCGGGALQADRGKFLEQYGGAEMKCEAKRFQEDVLDKIHHDNVSNPEYIAEEGVKQLRIHHQCLQDICRNIWLECIKYPGGANQDIEQQQKWCENQADRLLELQKSKLHYIASTNQERKERSLLDEKFAAIRERFRKHIHERMNQLLTHIRRFESKVDRLIYKPH